MKLNLHVEIFTNRFYVFTVGLLFLIINGFMVKAQSISKVQDLNFGNFMSYGSGGTVTVTPLYTFSHTGEILLRGNPSPASFDLYVEPMKTVQISYNKNVTLVGDHGGTIKLVLTDSSPTGNGSIVTGLSPTRVTLGGTMTIARYSMAFPGNYSGSVSVNFIVNN